MTRLGPAAPSVSSSDPVHPAVPAARATATPAATVTAPAERPRGEDVGMTATAFLSVSLDPPLVM
ncbi:flavin reductase, partial [Streptomyces lavendulocolor]